MDLDSIVITGILGAAAVNAIALAGVLWISRPERRSPAETFLWKGRKAAIPQAVKGQPKPADLAA